jgi:gliding motility-associated protein GldC
MAHSAQIRFAVELDENRVPERIAWEAEEGGVRSECKATLISVWDEKEQNTLRVDLWTKAMNTEEMKRFFHQNILTLSDTFERATGEREMAEHMRAFGHFFGEKMLGLDPP